jgi:hypothetical protein
VLRKCRFIGRPTSPQRIASIALGRLQIYSGPAISDPKMLGLDVPPRLFAHADGVIE